MASGACLYSEKLCWGRDSTGWMASRASRGQQGPQPADKAVGPFCEEDGRKQMCCAEWPALWRGRKKDNHVGITGRGGLQARPKACLKRPAHSFNHGRQAP